ncbi:hypothetical protein LINPERPRIM_LOCUS10836, partial [Linum perenne]
ANLWQLSFLGQGFLGFLPSIFQECFYGITQRIVFFLRAPRGQAKSRLKLLLGARAYILGQQHGLGQHSIP